MKAFLKAMKQTHNTVTAEFNSLACYDAGLTLKSLSTRNIFFLNCDPKSIKMFFWIIFIRLKEQPLRKKEDFINFKY